VQQAVGSVLDYLTEIATSNISPAIAKDRLRHVQSRLTDIELQLVWEKESYDGSIHYDVLVRLPEHAVISLSYCRDRALPWPLRGVRRWSEMDLLAVNATGLRVDQAIACLDFVWNDASLSDRLIDVCLMQEEFDRNPVELTDLELQAGMDAFRRAHKLCNAHDTLQWLQIHGMTHGQLDRVVSDNLAIAKLRDRIAEGKTQSYFDEHSADFDTAVVAQIECNDEVEAREIYLQLLSKEMDFYECACRRHSMPKARYSERPFFSRIRRYETSLEVAAKVFSALPGEILEPVRLSTGYVIMHVLSLIGGKFDESTEALVKTILLQKWLTDRKATARISWFWGTGTRSDVMK